MLNVGTKARQFLNVVTEKCSGGLYLVRKGASSLRRIKASELFYGSTEEALLAQQEQEAMAAADPCAKNMMTRSRLPPPQIKFKQSRPVDCWMDFWPFYGTTSESSKILCVDAAGEAVLYDAGAGTLETLPRLRVPMGRGSDVPDHVALSVTLSDAHDPARPDALYVMDHKRGSFEALVYGEPSPYMWRWRQLPMPPFTRDHGHGSIGSYVMLPEAGRGGTICVSSVSDKVGTYCFDTSTERWTKAAGSWRLPFRGRAQVVPELDGLCFGVGSYPYCNHLCAVDLSSAVSMDDGPPKLRHHWPLMETPAANVRMAYMGAGRFCVATTFFVYHQDPRPFGVDHETVFNGVEVVRENGGGASEYEPKLRMINHKCVRYRLIDHRINVL